MVVFQEPNHWLFQLANAFLLVSYVSVNVAMLRLALLFAGASFALWGWFVLDVSLDTFLWNAVFVVINAAQLMRVLIRARPYPIEDETLAAAYAALFERAKLSRYQFMLLARRGEWREYAEGDVYAEAGDDSGCLALLVDGAVEARTADGRLLNLLKPFTFIDSPQWIARHEESGARYPVRFVATAAKSRVLYWSHGQLEEAFRDSGGILRALDYVCGLDVARKLFAVDVTITGGPEEVARIYRERSSRVAADAGRAVEMARTGAVA